MKFLDLEAQIDSDDEFSEDENDDNGFIDHGTCQTPYCLIC